MTFHRDDLPCLFSDFGIEATIAGELVTVIFEEPYAEDLGISGSSPAICVQESQLPSGVVDGTEIVISGVTYAARTMKPNGKGLVIIQIEAQS